MKSLALVLLATVLVGAPAFADDGGGLFVEPMVTLGRDTADIKTSSIPLFDDTNGTVSSYGVGAKLGMHINDVFFAGLDGRFNRSKMSDSSYGSPTGNGYNVGVTAGVQMPVVGLRVFGTYVPFGGFDPEAGNQGVDLKFKKAKGFRVGAGFRVAMVSLNLEYQVLKYDQTEVQSIGSSGAINGTTNVDYETKGWVASVSFPLDL
jgi:hypothetical protein